MKRFLFSLWYVGKDNRKQVESHEESFECQADAQVRARAILNEAKRDKCGLQIDLYEKRGNAWKNIVSYQ